MDNRKLEGLIQFLPLALCACAFSALTNLSWGQSVQWSDVYDPDYYQRRGTLSGNPVYLVEEAVSKSPAYVNLGTPTVSGDTLSSQPVTYGFSANQYFRDGSGNVSQIDGFYNVPELVSAEQIVTQAESLIGTPWEDATCGALIDAGFLEPCAIPPLVLPDVEPAPDPALSSCRRGYQPTYTSNAELAGAATLSQCIINGVLANAAAYPSLTNMRLARTTCTGTSTKVMTYYVRWGTSTGHYQIGGQAVWTGPDACFNLFVADPLPDHVQGAVDPYNPEPEPEPVPSDATDGEIAKILSDAGVITPNYLIDHSTGNITYFSSQSRTAESVAQSLLVTSDVPSVTVSWSETPVAGAQVIDKYTNGWPGPSGDGGGTTPTPTPTPASSPTPNPTPGGDNGDSSPQCVDFPNSLGCADADGFQESFISGLMDSLREFFVGDGSAFESEAPVIETVEAELPVSSEALDFVAACPAPMDFTIRGINGSFVVPLDYTKACEQLEFINPIVLLGAVLGALYILQRA